MIIGYARTSTADQIAGLEAQLRDLRAAGCERLFHEQMSGSSRERRPQLEEALTVLGPGDTLIVTALTRLGRSVKDLLDIKGELDKKGVGLKILEMSLDTKTPIGEMMFTVIGAIAQFERQLMLERQKEGIAKAKAEGKYVGRQPTAWRKTMDVLRLKDAGMTRHAIANELQISVRSVDRILDANGRVDRTTNRYRARHSQTRQDHAQ